MRVALAHDRSRCAVRESLSLSVVPARSLLPTSGTFLTTEQGRQHSGERSPPARSLFPIAPPVDRLNVLRMVVSPRSSHATGIDMVGYDVGIVGELFFADRALAVLGNDFFIQELSHFRIRADLPVSSRVLEIIDSTHSHLALTLLSRDRLPAAAE